MSVHYELIINGHLTLMQMHKNLTQVASFSFKVDKNPQFWRLDSQLGRFIIEIEKSTDDAYAQFYNPAHTSERILCLYIEIHPHDPRTQQLEKFLMEVIIYTFQKEDIDFVFYKDEKLQFQRIDHQLIMSVDWSKKWAYMCEWHFEIK